MGRDDAYHQVSSNGDYGFDQSHNKPKRCGLISALVLSSISVFLGTIAVIALAVQISRGSFGGIRKRTKAECTDTCALTFIVYSFIFLGIH